MKASKPSSHGTTDQRPYRDPRITAHHEAAHAVVALLLPDARNPVWVTLCPDGRGYTLPDPTKDTTKLSKAEVFAEVTVACAGYWAEVFSYPCDVGDATIQAGDFKQAQALIAVNLQDPAEAAAILEEGYRNAEALVIQHRESIQKIAALLLEKGHLTMAEIRNALP